MRLIREFDDFMSDLSLTQPEQAMIRDFVKKYEKYFKFHDPAEFENSLDKIVDDVMSTYKFPPEKRDDVMNYISSLHDLSDGISVIMSPNPQITYRTQPDMVQTILI
jgi:hypothetical protein